jgi:hypothetical protein
MRGNLTFYSLVVRGKQHDRPKALVEFWIFQDRTASGKQNENKLILEKPQ